MNAPSPIARPPITYNARVGAITLALGAFLTLVLTHTTLALAPIRILTLALAGFAVWSLSDEMGLRKPLNRAAMVCFAIAAWTKVQLALGVDARVAGRYLLLESAFLLLAVLFWSIAFLHRGPQMKVVGAVGAAVAAGPVIAIVIGHVVVGAAGVLGVAPLLAAAAGDAPGDTGFVTLVERIFGLWGYVAAWMLWRGHVAPRAAS
jgi:hypothetical protein